ncbi:hypothetical protein BH09PSE6_BH09PSE6_01610 [soil metagenome]
MRSAKRWIRGAGEVRPHMQRPRFPSALTKPQRIAVKVAAVLAVSAAAAAISDEPLVVVLAAVVMFIVLQLRSIWTARLRDRQRLDPPAALIELQPTPDPQSPTETQPRPPRDRPRRGSMVEAWRDGYEEPFESEYLPVIPDRPTRWDKSVFDLIEWHQFEVFIDALFKQAGFVTLLTSRGPEIGVDVRLYAAADSLIPTRLVRAKHYNRDIEVERVRGLKLLMDADHIERGRFVTSSLFSEEARGYANHHGISMYDGPRLLGEIARRAPDKRRELLELTTQGEFWRPTCFNCGIKLLGRAPEGNRRAYWSCRNEPQCRVTMRMKDDQS